jgi:DNA gyrase subunit B
VNEPLVPPPSSNDYNADKIQVLEGLEAVRRRPAMYIGDIGVNGLHHLVYEVVDNSIDEAMIGECRTISVRIEPDDSVVVTDDGRGIPVDIHKTEKVPAVQVIMTVLHSGGKFDRQTYKVSGGLHGVGVSVVNALSEWLEVEVFRDGRIWFQTYERGAPTCELSVRGRTDRRGTRVHFKPDRTIFETTVFSFEILLRRVRDLAYLNPGVTLSIEDLRPDSSQRQSFCFEDGLREFVRHLNENKQEIHPEIVTVHREEQGYIVDLAFQYHDGFTETLYSYVNNIHTTEGGTHLSGLKAGLTRSLNNYAKRHALVKKEEEIPSGDDFREGLTAVLSVKVPEPQFEGQTKTKLGNRDVQGIVEQAVGDAISEFLEEHPKSARMIIDKAVTAKRAREAARKARELVQRKSALLSGGLPGKLADCSSRDIEKSEIFIVEGDSAGGTAKQGRDRSFQAILPIRGKILNVEKARIDKMLQHQEIQTIIQALGTGIGTDDFDVSGLRYGKVIIMTDADVDGSHIRTLLLTFFFRHMAPLVERGIIHIAQPPLYRVGRKGREQYVHDEDEMKEVLLGFGIEGARLLRLCDQRVFEGEDLRELMTLASRLEQQGAIVERLGIRFHSYLDRRDPLTGDYPLLRVRRRGEPARYFSSHEEFAAFRSRLDEETGHETRVSAAGDEEEEAADLVVQEVRESRAIRETVDRLEALGFRPGDVFASRGGPAVAHLVYNGAVEVVSGLREVLEGIRRAGQKAIGENKVRYKGLGEMNPDQLRETAMDPATRKLVQVTVEDAIETDRIFCILMGPDVEPRREFIERHALDVKELDV